MRHFLFLPALLFTSFVYAQPNIKTVPGSFISDLSEGTAINKVSSSGNAIVLRPAWNKALFFDVQKGTMTTADISMYKISRDHRYVFDNGTYVVRWNELRQPCWGRDIKSVGIMSDTAIRRITSDFYALDIDEKSNIIATKIWIDSISDRILGMKGIYKIDRVSGNIVQTLREDTLFTCNDRYRGCGVPTFYLQKNYIGVGVNSYLNAIDIYPLSGIGTPKITIAAHHYHTAKADSLYVFTITDSTLSYNFVNAFDTRTGERVARKMYNRAGNTSLRFEPYGNKMYYLRPETATLLEETVTKGVITTTKTWDLGTLLGLAKDQYWSFLVAKGPSFFIAPVYLQKGESGGEAANTAHILQAATNKTLLKVFPFFNRTAADVARQAKDARDSKAYRDKIAREKDSIAHPERYCHLFWNTRKWYRGLTIFWGGSYRIMAEYDCIKDQYKLWQPAQLYNGNGHYMKASYMMVGGREFREGNFFSRKQYGTCTECDGDGTYLETIYTTKTKELPWGYFSGIETKKVTTTSTTMTRQCQKCMGNGVVLQ